MSEWIEINLPWDNREWLWPQYREYPNLDERGRSVFGKTPDEVRFLTVHSVKGSNDYTWPILDAYDRLRSRIANQIVKEDGALAEDAPAEAAASFNDEIRKRLVALDDINVKMVLEYHDFKKKYDAWLDSQPEILAVAEHNEQLQKAFKAKQKTDGASFRARELNRAGTLMEVKTIDGKIRQVLIGTINELGGSCDDCLDINGEDIVLKYKIVWQPEE